MSGASGLSADDYTEILNLYAYYNACSDTGDAEGYASCFTVDGVLVSRGLVFSNGAFARGQGEYSAKGRDELVAHKRRDRESRGNRYRRHWNGSIFLQRVDGTSVRGRCYLEAFDGEPGSLPVLAQTGVYEDLIVKIEGEWRFARRTVAID
jgi:hypothetical protein